MKTFTRCFPAVFLLLLAACGPPRDDAPSESSEAQSAPPQSSEAQSLDAESFVLIPAGTFSMGSPEDEPGRYRNETQHEVTLSAFYMQRTPVTYAQWNEIQNWASRNGYDLRDTTQKGLDLVRGGANTDPYPVTGVSWHDAVKWLNAWSELHELNPVYRVDGEIYRAGIDIPTLDMTANGYRLPTESEWEYAARAGTTTAFHTGQITEPWGADPILDQAGWYRENSDTGDGRGIHPVGRKQANAWGLYDMHGNVWEWCWDGDSDYPTDPQTDPTGPSLGFGTTRRVTRGGTWELYARDCRSAYRSSRNPDAMNNDQGFRPAHSFLP